MPETVPKFGSASDVIDWISNQRNDLEGPALFIAPEIEVVLQRLATLPGARLSRMSGSGATCFALFDRPADAVAAELTLRGENRDWWLATTQLC